jgi:predicted TIM-barrel fold metal-dependent hydrolase
LIHTGGIECAHASRFENIIRKNKQQTFVLCHGRPSEEAFMMLNKYDNVWVDTAFLSIDKIKTYISEFNEDRILFGSDYPINRWFSEHTDDEKWYNKQIKDISESFPFRVSEKMLCKNFLKLFGNE